MKKSFIILVAICVAVMLMVPLAATAKPGHHPPVKPRCPTVSVPAGETREVTETMRLCRLTIAEGANLVAPEGYSLTLTVNGVETGQAMADISGDVPDFSITSGVDTAFVPGTYRGNIVLTVAEANILEYGGGGGGPPPGDDGGGGGGFSFPFRQGLYLDEVGIDWAKSVPAAVIGKKPMFFGIKNILIRSDGECFNGIFVAGGSHTVKNAKIKFEGNGRSDFIGYGAAVTARGEDTTLVLDKARIVTKGVVRSGVIADEGCNVIVKNSYIQTYDGILPGDYISTIDTTQMRDAPWMLGLRGTTRATNLLGTETQAAYINSYVGSEGWGVLSTDGCQQPILTVINSTIATIGETGGYGSYVIGNATEYFYGCTLNVATYANIFRGGTVYYNDSTRALVEDLNESLPLGLTAKELKRIRVKPTVVNSENWGAKWHGGGTVNVAGGTVFNTANACFLVKDQSAVINVDGSDGAQFNPADGIILELIDNDDCGPGAGMYNTNTYYERTIPPDMDPTWDVTSTANAAVATFSNIDLEGDFYNSVGWTTHTPPSGSPSPSDTGAKRNLVLNFDNASITGVLSASQAHHEYEGVPYPVIDSETYYALGHLVNTASSVVNNGVIVFLNGGSSWTVTGTSYLSRLEIASDATITAPAGSSGVSMTVNNEEIPIEPGTYEGDIVLELNW